MSWNTEMSVRRYNAEAKKEEVTQEKAIDLLNNPAQAHIDDILEAARLMQLGLANVMENLKGEATRVN